MRIAAIDIGTNSVHMIVVNVRPDLSFEVIDREKEMVRLGAGGLGGRALTEEAMSAALQALSKFRRLAESHQVDQILAAATSATREAENGGEFLAAIERETGIRPQVISGVEEARLIHLAAVYGVDVAGESAVAIDIGGGSVEITLGTGTQTQLAQSFKLGVIRMTERFVRTDPISGKDERKLVKHITSEISDHVGRIVAAGFDRVIGTSGTILSLGTVAATEQRGSVPNDIRNLRISAKQLHRLRKTVVDMNLQQRLKIPGLDPRRADLVVAGAVILDTIIRALGADGFTLCDLALREGLILDYIQRNRKQIAQVERYPDIRRRSVVELGDRCRYWPEHASQVAKLALGLFDQTRSVHQLTDREREWLEYASLLHDVGVHISYPRHHKHSYYLIKNGDLRGFEPDEIEAIGLIARYHRSAAPKKSHDGFGTLPGKTRRTVKALAALLRLAESLDRSHAQVVSRIELHDRGDDYLLKLRTTGDAELEVWAANRQMEPLERLLGKPVRIGAADGHTHAEQTHDAARVPGKTVRRRGHRRVREDHAARPAGKVARRRGSSRVRNGVELVGAGQGRHENGEEKERTHADDVQSAARHGLRRSAALQDHSAAQGRNDRAR
jgi:exopolyphosphatase/guanosine-5'-triphosphate,3'-diphosphate pyrophosphatase